MEAGGRRAALFCQAAMIFFLIPSAALGGPPGHRIEANGRYATPATAPGGVVDSASLVENARIWDGRVITFSGEVVGDVMVRGDFAWVHLNDDAYMWKNIEEGAVLGGFNSGHAIWAPADSARRITFTGDYKHEGDVVRVRGTFHAACAEHGGDMDIHAQSLYIIRPGHPVGHVVNLRRLLAGFCLLALAGVLRYVRHRAELKRI